MALFEPLLDALNRAGVRYVIVGGLAVVLHGHPRLTADVDLVVDLEPPGALKAIEALVGLGFVPRAPVDPRDFADPARRAEWVRDKGMRVFSLWDPRDPLRSVDLFVEPPVPFDALWERSEVMSLAATDVRVAAIADLVALKRLAGRPQDLADIEALQEIARLRGKSRG